MTHYHHPVFGAITADRRDLDPAMRALDAKLHDISEGHAEASRQKREAEIAMLLRALDAIGTDAPLDLPHEPVRANFCTTGLSADGCETPLGDTEWQDREGRIWDVKVRPRPVEPATPSAESYAPPVPQSSAPHLRSLSRYDKAFVANKEAQRVFGKCLRDHGPSDPRTASAADRLAKSRARFDKEKARGKQDVSRLQDSIDLYRQTPEGREEYNAKRRQQRSAPNADLSDKTPDQKREHKNAQAAARMRAKRERDRAERHAVS